MSNPTLEHAPTAVASQLDLWQPRRGHLVGACGAGMQAIAELLADRGWTLTGSDPGATGMAASHARQAGDPAGNGPLRVLHATHSAKHVTADVEVVIYSPAVPASNPERQEARNRGIVELSYVEAVSLLMRPRSGVCIAGTHGKTTTTAMVASILRGSAPTGASALIGGQLCDTHRSGWAGTGELLVVEACEYRRHFLAFKPHVAAILNIEPDHFDCFATLDAARQAFADFAGLIPADGRLIAPVGLTRAGQPATATDGWTIDEFSRCRVETFAIGPATADWVGRVDDADTTGSRVTVLRHGEPFCQFHLRIPGRHNVGNAVAAAAVAHAAGADARTIAAALEYFRGVRRRFEVLGDVHGATLIDDYAHHPTAVQATLAAARERFPGRRLVAAFQPHQVGRTRALMSEFAASFDSADEVYLVPIFAARENTDEAAETLDQLRSAIAVRGTSATVLTSLDRLRDVVDHAARLGDVWLMMGAGDIDRVARACAEC